MYQMCKIFNSSGNLIEITAEGADEVMLLREKLNEYLERIDQLSAAWRAPQITTKEIKTKRYPYTLTHFYADGQSLGAFGSWEEDASATSIGLVFKKLAEMDMVKYETP